MYCAICASDKLKASRRASPPHSDGQAHRKRGQKICVDDAQQGWISKTVQSLTQQVSPPNSSCSDQCPRPIRALPNTEADAARFGPGGTDEPSQQLDSEGTECKLAGLLPPAAENTTDPHSLDPASINVAN